MLWTVYYKAHQIQGYKIQVLGVILSGNRFKKKYLSLVILIKPKLIMKSTLLLLAFTLFSYSQTPEFYKNKKGDLHLCGEFSIEELEQNESFKTWFKKNYSDRP